MYKISDECTACGACAPMCPVDAIVESDGKYTVTDDCVDCGSCVSECPVDAIKAE